MEQHSYDSIYKSQYNDHCIGRNFFHPARRELKTVELNGILITSYSKESSTFDVRGGGGGEGVELSNLV